jgi:outer membrane receptor for monomeric catechols
MKWNLRSSGVSVHTGSYRQLENNRLNFRGTTQWSHLQVDYIMVSPSRGLNNGLNFKWTT